MQSQKQITAEVRGILKYECQDVASLRGVTCRLLREKTNRHDRNAISVVTADSRKVGYLAKEVAVELAPRMDAGVGFSIRLKLDTYAEEKWGCCQAVLMSQDKDVDSGLCVKRIDSPVSSASTSITLSKIIAVAARGMTRVERKWANKDLNHGVSIIEDPKLLDKYLVAYGQMHEAKLRQVFPFLTLPNGTRIQIIDWGCGQGLATAAFLDYFKNRFSVHAVRLLEASNTARERACDNIRKYGVTRDVKGIPWIKGRKLSVDDFEMDERIETVHLFSNILDVTGIDFANIVSVLGAFKSRARSHLVAVGPCNSGMNRIKSLLGLLGIDDVQSFKNSVLEFKNSYGDRTTCTCYGAVGSFGQSAQSALSEPVADRVPEPVADEEDGETLIGDDGSLVPETFEAGACADVVFALRDRLPDELLKYELVSHENRLLFHYASDSVPPYLAVLNNMVVRGTPTRAGILVEDYLAEDLGLTRLTDRPEVIEYEATKDFSAINFRTLFDTLDPSDKYQRLVAIPLLVSRVQHAVLRGAASGLFDINQKTVSVLAHERDFPCVRLALDELSQMIGHLVAFMGVGDLTCPKFKVVSLTDDVLADKDADFDIFLDVSFGRNKEHKDLFPDLDGRFSYGARLRGVGADAKPRAFQLMTGENIAYAPLCEKRPDGTFAPIEDCVGHLRYFLRNLFRKSDFRPGQLPILNRALQLKSVIGLLPTGAGKSLTYQLSGMMQPGAALVVDPIKSLMKDQHDGLVRNGITACTYINSSLKGVPLRQANEKFLTGGCKFIFVSPERLSMPSFRWQLRELYENRFYFSYGVVDEVHCVSEWGHQFRFNYLHLGRNLHRHVRCKGDGVVPLFGLTATASFDVLADVERELSGAYAYKFDPDVVVRYENTNRLELQYRIWEVPNPSIADVKDEWEKAKKQYESAKMNGMAPNELGRLKDLVLLTERDYKREALQTEWRAVYDDKNAAVSKVIDLTEKCFGELNEEKAIEKIKRRFLERENIADDSKYGQAILQSRIEQELDRKAWTKEPFSSAGVVFCPHKGKGFNTARKNPAHKDPKDNTTAISVKCVHESLAKKFSEGVVRYFAGSIEGDALFDQITQKNQDEFIANRAGLMVATTAFGLGIDKPNIRFVIEVNHPSSLEDFVQQAGRAGRDRKMALATLMVSQADVVDKDVVTFFHHNNFIGARGEKEVLRDLFKMPVDGTPDDGGPEPSSGFLETLLSASPGRTFQVTIPYQEGSLKRDDADVERQDVINKLVYRLACIGVVRDIEGLYPPQRSMRKLRLTLIRLKDGGYFEELRQFLLRYFNEARAEKEMEKVRNHKGENEIHKCIGYLTDFVYEHIEKKRKRAIDEMHRFCLYGIEQERNRKKWGGGKNWLDVNEDLKDYIYYYFNSKYARSGYQEANGEDFSLLDDAGKESQMETFDIVRKYLRVVDDDVVGSGSPKDNVKHLQGAIRLISRGQLEPNPALAILNVFCIAFLGVQQSETLMKEARESLCEQGFLLLYKRGAYGAAKLLGELNGFVEELRLRTDVEETPLNALANHARRPLHAANLKTIIDFYTEGDERDEFAIRHRQGNP